MIGHNRKIRKARSFVKQSGQNFPWTLIPFASEALAVLLWCICCRDFFLSTFTSLANAKRSLFFVYFKFLQYVHFFWQLAPAFHASQSRVVPRLLAWKRVMSLFVISFFFRKADHSVLKLATRRSKSSIFIAWQYKTFCVLKDIFLMIFLYTESKYYTIWIYIFRGKKFYLEIRQAG